MFIKKKAIILVISMVILASIFSYFFLSYRDSAINKGFPIPLGAKLLNKDDKEMYEEYKWGPASEENGLPLYYLTVIKLWGWDKKSQEGAMTIYEKDGKKLCVISQTDSLFVSPSEED
ncbi:hypothetical protein [Peribacillus frigoritolerans]|uniref:DUF4944 domain-containing protein n=1 Tax=Peribacillus castrilensis TaxID=2897690 RepID=A0AAW9N3R3_9BACI|nr:hypothetical protein [Peribacillus castrilensis]